MDDNVYDTHGFDIPVFDEIWSFNVKMFMSIIYLVTIVLVAITKVGTCLSGIGQEWMGTWFADKVPSLATIRRRVRINMMWVYMLTIAYLIITCDATGRHTLQVDDTTKVGDIYQSLTLTFFDYAQQQRYIPIGYFNTYSKSADGAAYAMCYVCDRLNETIYLWRDDPILRTTLEAVHGIDFLNFTSIYDRIYDIQGDRASVNKKLFNECRASTNYQNLEELLQCHRHDSTNSLSPSFKIWTERRETNNIHYYKTWIEDAVFGINERYECCVFNEDIVYQDLVKLKIGPDDIITAVTLKNNKKNNDTKFNGLVNKLHAHWQQPWNIGKPAICALIEGIGVEVDIVQHIGSNVGTCISCSNYLAKLFKLSSKKHYQKSSTLIANTYKDFDRLNYHRLKGHLKDLGYARSQRLSNQEANASPALYVGKYIGPIFYAKKSGTAVISNKEGKPILGPLVFAKQLEDELLVTNFQYDCYTFPLSERIGKISVGENKHLLRNLCREFKKMLPHFQFVIFNQKRSIIQIHKNCGLHGLDLVK